MNNSIGRRVGVVPVADSLARALDSGDRRCLESAINRAAAQLMTCRPGSSLETERRELLLGIVESLCVLLRSGGWESGGETLGVCHDLLRQVRGDDDGCRALWRPGAGAP